MFYTAISKTLFFHLFFYIKQIQSVILSVTMSNEQQLVFSNEQQLVLSLIDELKQGVEDGLKKSCLYVKSVYQAHLQQFERTLEHDQFADTSLSKLEMQSIDEIQMNKPVHWDFALKLSHALRSSIRFMSIALDDILSEFRMVLALHLENLHTTYQVAPSFDSIPVFNNRVHVMGGVRPPSNEEFVPIYFYWIFRNTRIVF